MLCLLIFSGFSNVERCIKISVCFWDWNIYYNLVLLHHRSQYQVTKSFYFLKQVQSVFYFNLQFTSSVSKQSRGLNAVSICFFPQLYFCDFLPGFGLSRCHLSVQSHYLQVNPNSQKKKNEIFAIYFN